jgi:hypothetical protein
MDKKYEIHLIAEKIAEEEYQCEFYELSKGQQDKVWTKAEVEFEEKLMDRADNIRKEW